MAKYKIISLLNLDKKEFPNEMYIVDCKRKRIIVYQMYHDPKDETRRLQRMYEKEHNTPDRRIGCDLVDIMNYREPRMQPDILLDTDDAAEVVHRVARIRAYWFDIAATVADNKARAENAGIAKQSDPELNDKYIAEKFMDL